MCTEHFLRNSQFIPSHPRVLLESKHGFFASKACPSGAITPRCVSTASRIPRNVAHRGAQITFLLVSVREIFGVEVLQLPADGSQY